MPKTRHLVLCFAAYFACVLASNAQSAYDQPYRPQVHFSPREHWTNDPNGLVYFRGQYHLFFQYNPLGDEWGHMSWGHAVSPDLLHWRQLPVAIPEANGIMIFTGSVVVDRENTSGLCSPGTECLVAIYTGHSQAPAGVRQNQNLAYSRDNGTTWSKYDKNPVLDLHLSGFRDPSVSWDAAAHRWLMVVSRADEHKVSFYASPNLRDWTHLSDFGPAGDTAGAWECPDLLRVPSTDGKTHIWALKIGLNPGAPHGGSGEQYFLGSFNGTSFTVSPELGAHGWTNYGKDDYCAISFNGLPQAERPILMGWMNNWQYAAKIPTSPWRGQMSIPRRVSYVRDQAGLALRQEPIVASLRMNSTTFASKKLEQETVAEIAAPYELQLQFTQPPSAAFGIRLYSDSQHWTEIAFDTLRNQFYIDRTHSGLDVTIDFPARTAAPLAKNRSFDLDLIVDRSSVEAFAQDGTIAMTDLIFPATRSDKIQIFSDSLHPLKASGRLIKLRPIWPK